MRVMTEVHFINVGYGDAALIISRDQERSFVMLIDCGGASVGSDGIPGLRKTAADYLEDLGIRRIDIVLLSHLHLDHSGGLLALTERFEIAGLLTNYLPDFTSLSHELKISGDIENGPENLLNSLNIYRRALRELAKRNTVIKEIKESCEMKISAGMLCIHCGDDALMLRQKKVLDLVFSNRGTNEMLKELDGFINQTSLLAKLSIDGAAFLFPGDISADAWRKEGISKANVLKLPHHGHSDAINIAIAERISPQYTVISTSNTRTDGCPRREIIDLLERSSSQVIFTDAVKTRDFPTGKRHHAVRFSIDGSGKIEISDD